MKKLLFCAAVLALNLPNSAHAEFNGKVEQDLKERRFHDAYKEFKDGLDKSFGLTYDGAVSALAQRGSPSGHITPIQMQYFGEANWEAYQSDYGDGSFQVSYTLVRYSGREGTELVNNLGVLAEMNDYSANQRYLNQFSYTHKLPGQLDWISATVGQFPMWLFDGNPYASNQQTDFNNLMLSQNGTYTYPSASMGGFVTLNPVEDWTFVTGFQDANNIHGEEMRFDTFNDGDYTTFGSVAYTPTIDGLGKGKYALMLYNQPAVDRRPRESNGWSLNVAQDFGNKWGAFSRINGNDGSNTLKQSYAFGGVYKDPFERKNELDKIGLAVALNKINQKEAGLGSRSSEHVIEAYWDFGVSDYIIITPDVQYFIKPALNPEVDDAAVYSIRATLLF